MAIDLDLDDSDLSGFTEHAEKHLKEKIDSYASDLIYESNKLEAGSNSTDKPTEVTTRMVEQASILLRGGMHTSSKSWGDVFIEVLASILPFTLGLMYNSEMLRKEWYMFLFILVLIITVVSVTTSVIKD